jgi:phosphoribosyl 1,2-cyclic phosphodiesterase
MTRQAEEGNNTMGNEEFSAKFRGVRGGYPMPGPTTVKYGGNTTCLEVRVGGHLIIIDAGTGVIGLGQEMLEAYTPDNANDTALKATLLLTHLHYDHIQGLPFFTPLLHPKGDFAFFGPQPMEGVTMEECIEHTFLPPFYSVMAEELLSKRQYTHVRNGDMILLTHPQLDPVCLSVRDDQAKQYLPEDDVVIQVHRGYHHPRNGILIFRINYHGKSLVFATDTEGYTGGDRKLINFARGADLLIHDAEYDTQDYANLQIIKQGWGHSTWEMAVEVARAAEVKQLALIHHNPMHSDAYLDAMEKKAQAAFPAAFMAREGQTVTL